MSAWNTAEIVAIRPVNTTMLQGLCKSVIYEAGDFIFIPADVPHKRVNLSATDPFQRRTELTGCMKPFSVV